MRLNSLGDIVSGVGDNQITLWLMTDPAARPIGRGGAAGWLSDFQILGAGPSLVTAGNPAWTLEPFRDYQPNDAYAGGQGKWIASRAAENTLQGTVPPGYEAWKAHDVGPDGTMVLVMNGIHHIFWPDGTSENIGGSQLRACEAGLVLIDLGNIIKIFSEHTDWIQPQQIPGAKWWCVSVGKKWLLYLADGYGLVLHHVDDATQGYQWNVAPYSPCGVTLADGRTLIAWSTGAAEQAADLVRVFVTLGVGMSPLLPLTTTPEPPIDPPVPPVEPPIPPIDPEPPNPEPEPMPPTNPLKPGKTADAYWEALAHTISTVPNNLMSFDDAKQGIRQTWDQLNAAQDWQHGNALVRGACSRSSSAAVVVPATTWDAVSPIVRAIDLEFLQRG